MKEDKPVKAGRTYEMDINSMGVNGEGIGRIEGFTVFVENAVPGDRVEVEIQEVKKRFARGVLKKVLIPSVQRAGERCPLVYRCGGCQIQQVDYRWQLEYKTQKVKDSIERIAKLDGVTIHPTIGMENPWRYRNKAQFPVGHAGGRIATGFYERKTHKIVDIGDCLIQHGINRSIVREVREYMESNGIPAYDEGTGKGIVRHIVTRVAFATGEVMVVIVATNPVLPKSELLVERLVKNIPPIKSIVLNINNRKTNVILGKECITLWGQDYITDCIGDLQFRISPLSFYQVNPVQTLVLYNKALEYADLKGGETVIDVYCGIGTISLFLARRAAKVYGIEVVKEAVEDARINAQINGIGNAEFITGQAEEVMPRLFEDGIRPDVIVVDPPRKGCEESLLETIVSMRPDRVVYVSCNPATLARDLKYLDQRGYRTVEIQPVDMFPHTAHVECIVLITRAESRMG